MSVLSRSALEASPLSDLHEIASEVGIDGFRRLRKEDLVDAILGRQGGEENGGSAAPAADTAADDDTPAPRSRSRSRRPASDDGDGDAPAPRSRSRAPRSADDGDRDGDDEAPAPRSRSRSRRPAADDDRAPAPRTRSRSRAADEGDDEAPAARSRGRRGRDADDDAGGDEQLVEGTLEVLANGSGFLRPGGGEASDDDVYVSAAQIRRCELVAGDVVAGPLRRARRSERHPSLIRVTTINGVAAEEVSDGTRYADRGAAFPTEPFAFKAKDATLKQIADQAPIGRGSRVTVSGPSGSGRTTTLRLLAIELAAEEGIELQVVLAGARPEELAEWTAAELTPSAVADLGARPDEQAQAVDRAIDGAKRAVARGANAAVVIDALDALPEHVARRALAAARNVPDGGSLTVIAAARAPLGGETTTIVLDQLGAVTERRPVLAPQSHTLRVEALVGARKATTVAKNQAKALTGEA